MPLQRSLNFFASPLHISNGVVIQGGLTLLVQGASCLHSVGFALERQALGTARLPLDQFVDVVLTTSLQVLENNVELLLVRCTIYTSWARLSYKVRVFHIRTVRVRFGVLF